MKAICIINRKGGSAKTSTAFHIGGTLAKRGRRVLLVDVDPQSSLTQGILGSKSLQEMDASRSIARLWASDPLPEQIIHPTSLGSVWLVPGHEDATRANMIPEEDWGDRILAIREMLQDVRGDYDYALLDCPPNLHLCSHAALVASDEAIVPLQPEDYGAQGLVAVTKSIRAVRERWGRPDILGYLLTMFDKRLAIHTTYREHLLEVYGDKVMDTVIPVAAAYKEAVSARMPISHYKPKSAPGKIMSDLADEIERRLEARCGESEAA